MTQQQPSIQPQVAKEPSAAPEKKSAASFKRHKEWLLLALLCLWGYLLVTYPPFPYSGLLVPLFGLSLTVLAIAYLFTCGKKPCASSWLYLAATSLSSLGFGLFENSGIAPWLMLFHFLLFAIWLLHVSGNRALTAGDIPASFGLVVAKPFSKLSEKWQALMPKSTDGIKASSIFIGLIITLPVLTIAGSLLANADQAFGDAVTGMMNYIAGDFSDALFRLLPAVLVGAYLFSLLFSVTHSAPLETSPSSARIGSIPAGILVGSLCLLYVIFLGVRLSSTLGIMEHSSQDPQYYSTLARDGFFELSMVSLLNLVVFLITHVFVREKTALFRGLLTALGVLTQLIIVTGIVKMAAYMDVYGLTLLRVQTTWFMVSLLLAFAVLVLSQWKKINAFQWIAILCTLSVLGISYANMGGLVARENVSRYLSGSLEEFSTRQYARFPHEATPHLVRLYVEDEPGETRTRVGEMLWIFHHNQTSVHLLDMSAQQMAAEKELEAFINTYGHEITPPDMRY